MGVGEIIAFNLRKDSVKVSFAGELRHVRATSALKKLVREKGLEIGFRMRIFVESVVDG